MAALDRELVLQAEGVQAHRDAGSTVHDDFA
jgi:hypothetical protein